MVSENTIQGLTDDQLDTVVGGATALTGNFEEFVYSEGSKSLVMVSADSSNFQSWAATKEKMQKVLTAYESQGFSEITLYSGGDAGNGKRFSIAEVRSWL